MSQMSSTHAILFDLDETLVDVDSAIAGALHEFRKQYGKELGLNRHELEARWRELFEVHYTRFLRGEITFECQKRCRVQDLFSQSRPLLQAAQADEISQTFDTWCQSRWRSFPEVQSALEQLSDIRLGIISNGDPAEQKMKLALCGLLSFFPHVFTPAELGTCKPHAAAFVRACEMLGCKPQNCLYIGDRLDIDAIASTEAGLTGVWLDRSPTATIPEVGVHVIRHLGELPHLLRQINF